MSGGFGGNPSDSWSDNDLGFPQQYLPLYQQWLAHKNASGGDQPVDPAAFIAAAAASGHVDTRTWAALGLGQVNLGSSVGLPSKEINFSTNDSARNFGAQQSDTPLTWRRGQEPTLGSLKSQLEKAASGIPLKPTLKKPGFKPPRKPSESLAKKWDSSDRGELKMDMKPMHMTRGMEKHASSLTAQLQMAKPAPTVSSQAYSPAVGGSYSSAPFNPWPSSAVSASSVHLDGSSCQEVFFVLPVQVENISTDAHLQPSHTGTRISMALWEKVKTPLMPCKDDAMAQAVQAAFPVRVRGKTNLTVNIEGVTIVITNAMVFEGQTPVEALVLGIDIMLAAGLIWDVATSQICALAGRVPPRQMLNNERLIGCPATKEMLIMQQPPSSHSAYQEPWNSTAQPSGERSWPSQKRQSRRDHSPDSWGDSSFSSSRKDSWHDRHRDFSPGPPGRRDRRSSPITRQDRSPPPKSRQDRSPVHIGRRDRSPLSIGRRDRSPLSIGRRDRSPLSIGRRDRSPLSIGRRDRSPLSIGRRDRSPVSNTRRGRSPVPSRQDRSPLARRARSPLPSSRRDRSPLPSSRRDRSPLPSSRRDRSPLPSGRREQSPLSNSRRDRSPPHSSRRERSPLTNRAKSPSSRGYSPTNERQNYKGNNQRQSPKRTTDNSKTFQKTKPHANRKDGNSSLSQKDSSSNSKNQRNTSPGNKANSNQKQSSNSSDRKNSSSSAVSKTDSIVAPKVDSVSESKTESSSGSASKPKYTNQRNTSSRYGGANLKSVVNEEKDEKSSNVIKPAGPDTNTSSNAGLENDDPVVKSGELEQQSETDNSASQGDQLADSKLSQLKASQNTGKQALPASGKKIVKKTIVRRKAVAPQASVHKCKKRLAAGASQKPIGRGKQVLASGKTKIIRKVPARTAKQQTEDGGEPGTTQSTENQQEETQETKEDSGVDDIVLELSSDVDDSGTGTVTEAGGELELEDISASEGEDEEKMVEQDLEDVSSVSNSEMLDDVSDTELPNSDNEQKDSFSGKADQEDEMMEQVTDNEDEDYVEDEVAAVAEEEPVEDEDYVEDELTAVAEEEPVEDEDATEHLATEEEGNVEAEEAIEDGAEEEEGYVEAEEAIEDGAEEEGNVEAEEEGYVEAEGEGYVEAEEEGYVEAEEALDEEQPAVEQVGDANEQEDEEPLLLPECDADGHPEYDGGNDEAEPAEDIPEQNEITAVEDEQVVTEPSADDKGECFTKSETEPAENVDSTVAQPDNGETEHVDEPPKKSKKTVKKVTPKKVIKRVVKTRTVNTNPAPVTKRVIRTRRVVVKKK